MITNWIKKLAGSGANQAPASEKKPSEKQKNSQPKRKPQGKKKPHGGHAKSQSNAKPQHASKHKKQQSNAESTQSDWQLSDFQVPEVEGKTRFHDLGLHNDLMQAIHALGFDYCTPVQAQTLPHTLKGLDIIGKAQTGTGKTAAFLITIIDQILSHPLDEERYHGEPRALVIAPTRELVQQIAEDAKQLTHFSDVRVVSLVGGEPYDKQQKALDAGYVDLIVATPGRLIDFVQQKHVYLDRIETLVLDEADRMLDMGFIPQVKQIVRHTPFKENRQTLLFSATFTYDIINLSERWTVDPQNIEIEPESVATDTVEQLAYMVSDSEKFGVLKNILRMDEVKHSIIFANRRDQTQRLYDRLRKAGVSVGILSGEIAQKKRTKTLEEFKSGQLKTLIATDVVGRGIHIDGITHVINYNLPQEPENYVHRIGRTGRAGASGVAISLIGEEDAYELPQLESLLGKPIPMSLPPENLLE